MMPRRYSSTLSQRISSPLRRTWLFPRSRPTVVVRTVSICCAGRSAISEESAIDGRINRIFLTSHRPVQISDRSLLLSSSVDLTDHKAVEEELFRRAYFDELTGLPRRRVIETPATPLPPHPGAPSRFPLPFPPTH